MHREIFKPFTRVARLRIIAAFEGVAEDADFDDRDAIREQLAAEVLGLVEPV